MIILNSKMVYLKSRKGDYIYTRFEDDDGKVRVSYIKSRKNLTIRERENYIQKLSSTKKGSKEAKGRRVILKSENIKKEGAVFEGGFTNNRSYYKTQAEQTTSELLDSEHKLSRDGYSKSAQRIILKLRDEYPDLNKLSPVDFESKLLDYMSGNKGYKSVSGIKRVFLNDVVNKWASEFKRWD